MKIILDVDDDFEVIGCAANGQEAVNLARTQKADIVLMDIRMPVMNGTEATGIMLKEGLGKVLVLTTFDDDELVAAASQNSAKGYLITGPLSPSVTWPERKTIAPPARWYTGTTPVTGYRQPPKPAPPRTSPGHLPFRVYP